MAHTYYEPSEYEQMLIAAKWITPESVDPDYLEYCRKEREPFPYESWLWEKHLWDKLNEEYEELESSKTPLTQSQQEWQRQLLRQMGEIEFILGY